jgi:hypothetical protein
VEVEGRPSSRYGWRMYCLFFLFLSLGDSAREILFSRLDRLGVVDGEGGSTTISTISSGSSDGAVPISFSFTIDTSTFGSVFGSELWAGELKESDIDPCLFDCKVISGGIGDEP